MKYLKVFKIFEGDGIGFDLDREKEKIRYKKEIESMPKSMKPNDVEKIVTKEEIDKWLENNDIHWESDFILRSAIRRNDIDIVKYLILKGSDASSRRFGPIRIAIDKGNIEIVKYLLESVKDKLSPSAIDILLDWCGGSEISENLKNQISGILDIYKY